MKSSIAVFVLIVVSAGTVYTQTAPPASPSLPGPTIDPLSLPKVPQAAPQPPELTIDQLLDEIEKVRVQKAELEKKEQALMAEARKKVGKQSERLNRLGLGAPALDAPGLVPPGGITPPGIGAPPLPSR